MIDYVDTSRMFKSLRALLGDSWLMHYYETAMRQNEKPLLGQRLLEAYPDRVVYVVARPMSAILCAVMNVLLHDCKPVWVATGDAVLTPDHLKPLVNRNVFFMPTARQCSQWLDVMPPLGGAPYNWAVDRSLEMLAVYYDGAIDWDIGTIMLLPGSAWVTFYNRWGGDPIGLLSRLNLLPSYLNPDKVRHSQVL